MEDLTKHQLILLTLLVSFVTSIATGIITFTLLQEAPVEVTNTINRIVEQTIEKAVPGPTIGSTVKEVQVVSEEDLVLASIDKSAVSMVRIKTLGSDGNEIVTGLGFVISDGVVVTDSRGFTSQSSSLVFSDGKSYGISKSFNEKGITFLKVGKPQNETYKYFPASLGNADILKLGQTVIALSGKQSNAVSIGRVSQLETNEGVVSGIVTDIPLSKSQIGSPLLNISGEIVGLEAAFAEGRTSLLYTPIGVIRESLQTALAEFSK